MRIESDTYLYASVERIEDARLLMDEGRFAASLYFCGVAVECVIRAYLTRQSAEFDEKHDLRKLAKAAGFGRLYPRSKADAYGQHLTNVYARWHNNLRYATEQRARALLKRSQLDRGIRGDFLKQNCNLAYESAFALVAIGNMKWTTSKNA